MGRRVREKVPEHERRASERLPLAVPVFIRGHDERGKEFLEFATALNVSSGGALVAVGRSLVRASSLSLEIPSTPLDNLPSLPAAARRLRGRVVHIRPSPRCHLLGLKFSRPLLRPSQRKLSSPQ